MFVVTTINGFSTGSGATVVVVGATVVVVAKAMVVVERVSVVSDELSLPHPGTINRQVVAKAEIRTASFFWVL